MPKPRLPWFKVWVGATRHEKVVSLSDRAFRAWVELLDAASEQPVRGHFTSYAAAAAVIRRPVALVRDLGQVRLLDEREDGIWLHDWPDWQRWRPDDSHPNGTGITTESHTNGHSIPTESHTFDTPPRVERAKTETEKKTEKKDEDVRRKTKDGGAAAAARSADAREGVADDDRWCWKCRIDQENGAIQGHQGPCEVRAQP